MVKSRQSDEVEQWTLLGSFLLPHFSGEAVCESSDLLLLQSWAAAFYKVVIFPSTVENPKYFHTLLLGCFGVVIIGSAWLYLLVSSIFIY